MKIFRLAPGGPRVFCHDCHNSAVVEINLGAKRPPLRLCAHDAGYLVRVLAHRLEEVNLGTPIPKRRDEDSKGNR
jgi:hypothetical protein